MYTPVLRRNCIYCGRNNHISNACRYKNINLAKITRDPETKQLKKHFSRKININNSHEEARCINEPNKPNSKSTCQNGKKSDQKPRTPNSYSHDNDCKIVKEVARPPKKSPATSPSNSNTARNYLGCKDCVAWQMRLHQQANYWKEKIKD